MSKERQRLPEVKQEREPGSMLRAEPRCASSTEEAGPTLWGRNFMVWEGARVESSVVQETVTPPKLPGLGDNPGSLHVVGR